MHVVGDHTRGGCGGKTAVESEGMQRANLLPEEQNYWNTRCYMAGHEKRGCGTKTTSQGEAWAEHEREQRSAPRGEYVPLGIEKE